MKLVERDRARKLRRENGLPIKVIAAELGVSPSSVSRWVRDVELSAEQEAALRDANPIYNRQRSGTARSSANARARRVEAQQHGQALAQRGDRLHEIGCMLYWAEGSKSRNQVGFTNADPEMVDLFVHFLRRCYGVPSERIALTVNVHLGNGLTLEQIEDWWLIRLGLSRRSLRRAVVLVQSIFGAIPTYAGLRRSEWLG